MNNEKYICSFCGRKEVKLWRPMNKNSPLICAVCAEKRQTPLKCDQWKVDEDGRVPSYDTVSEVTEKDEKVYYLIVDLKESSETILLPAIPNTNKNGEWCVLGDVPDKEWKWWKNLPTK